MKLLSFLPNENALTCPLDDLRCTGQLIEPLAHLGLLWGASQEETVLDLTKLLQAHPKALTYIQHLDRYQGEAERLLQSSFQSVRPYLVPLNSVKLVAPLPLPLSLRDAYAFKQHVETSRKNRGLPMIPEFDQFPVFYFSNRFTTRGPGPVKIHGHALEHLDFELEVAAVLKSGGIDLNIEQSEETLFGFMIFNDLSARKTQMNEMKLSLGPCKGKDFANSFGPYLVTLDELEDRRIRGPHGSRWNLEMCARVNGKEVSRGNFKDMHWTFAQIIQRMSSVSSVFAGEVVGSGTVGTGCFLELNSYPQATQQWLQPGDVIELEVERLGILRTQISVD